MNPLSFAGRSVVITGAGQGVGRGYALELARRGANVAVNDISADHAHQVVAEIGAEGGAAIAVAADLGDPAAGERIVSDTMKSFGGVNAVISNASINGRGETFERLSVADLEAMLHVNVFGAWRLLQAAWAPLSVSGVGRVVLTTSQAALYGMPKLGEYALAKGAMLGLMRTLALEGAARGIKVNAIAPAAATRMTEQTVTDPTALDMLRALQPPHLVAPVAAILAHESCPVSGEIFLAGGAHVGRAFIGETAGVTLAAEEFTAEAVLKSFDAVRDETGYRVPRDVSETGDLAQKAEIMRRLRALGLIN